jgi:hypothetical protein
VGRFAISPHGTMLTFVGQSDGIDHLFLRHLDKNEITEGWRLRNKRHLIAEIIMNCLYNSLRLSS